MLHCGDPCVVLPHGVIYARGVFDGGGARGTIILGGGLLRGISKFPTVDRFSPKLRGIKCDSANYLVSSAGRLWSFVASAAYTSLAWT